MRHHLEDYLENQLNQLKKIPRPITIGLVCVFGVALVGWILPPILWPGGIGIGKDNPVSTMTIEKDAQGKTVKTIETIKYDDGKTLWDWVSLWVVPSSLLLFGYILQLQQQERAANLSKEQQKRAEDFSKEQQDRAEKLSTEQQERAEKLAKEQQQRTEDFSTEQQQRADNQTKEEVLQTYFDRLSVLLIDKNLIALSNKLNSNNIETKEKELLESSLDVIRARTLSILRRFENDAGRKGSVMNFLIETGIVGKSKLNLSRANLSGANLRGANLRGANLREANFQGADLLWANFQGADLSRANLQSAELSEANLSGANLQSAELQSAELSLANLKGADLRDIERDSKTVWPHKKAFIGAKNIPPDLKKELDITP